jgi:hypothetical protein
MSTLLAGGEPPEISSLDRVKGWLEYLGGARDVAPGGVTIDLPLLWAIWWSALFLAGWIFSGQASKFIYIDF